MYKAIYRLGKSNQKGFTLIELLIVVAIIAILAAIAIPQFSAYRKRGYNASANADLRNLRTSQEALYADFTDYGASDIVTHTGTAFSVGAIAGPGSTIFLCGGRTTTTSQSSSLSPGVYAVAEVSNNGTSNTSYSLTTAHGTGDQYYGADSDVTTLYRAGFVASATIPSTDILTKNPAAVISQDDFAAAGAAAWTAVQ
jgi:prepilin-type N-terminal cleavage/methylation domain-containing protein